jgi:hypothetical protein
VSRRSGETRSRMRTITRPGSTIGPESDKPHENDGETYNKDDTPGDDDDDGETVTLVRAQWWERVPVWIMLDPTDPAGKKS